ncbi:hypothetical protein Snoj_25590 [Streptomyces nojiriensis]|uniref:Helicase-associated domain-containing protein n=1 Tax=Streptomyces nojiriensis TaxID=66374 RepID=A0ABQ3SKI3_9ACTN|nr:hypothetical protein GCM10010205_69180 [Streptomyces nojiriensis]GHI68641.1 hypothetical protein Snoj_25590 [Streptomyces nojiriensis]
MVRTSAQELRLKAELSTVLALNLDRDTVRTDRVERVDMVADADGMRLVLEFDGSYYHESQVSQQKDGAKSERLRAADWTVVRIREAPLRPLNPVHDVVVGFLADPEVAAADVLDHLARLGLIDSLSAQRYRALGTPQASETARGWILAQLGEQALEIEYTAHRDAWDSMFQALAAYSAYEGHCYPQDGVTVDGRSLSRWTRKQRRLQRDGMLRTERAERLATIPTWSGKTAHEAGFWSRYHAYLLRAQSADPAVREHAMPGREATVWANNLRSRRQDLLAQEADLPEEQLAALEKVPGWSWDPYGQSHGAKVAVMRLFADETGRPVSSIQQREEWNGHPVGVWLNSWRTRRDAMAADRQAELEELPGWTWNQRGDQWEAMLRQLARFGEDHGHVHPSLTRGSEQEKALARWKRNQKHRLKGRQDAPSEALRALLAQHGEDLP